MVIQPSVNKLCYIFQRYFDVSRYLNYQILCTFPIALWIRHPLREREVEGSIPSVGDIGVRSDMAGW